MIYRCRHFVLSEIVCPHVLDTWGSLAWSWADERLTMTMDFLRDQLDAPIYINNYDMPEETRLKLGLELFDERGLRCIQCDIVKKAIKAGKVYCSGHLRFQASDFNVHGMTPEKVRYWLTANSVLLPFPIRIEKGTSGWTHIDTANTGTNKVELFIP